MTKYVRYSDIRNHNKFSKMVEVAMTINRDIGTISRGRMNLTALALDSSGSILSVGKNNYCKSHTYQWRMADTATKINNNPDLAPKIFIHAEVDAITRAYGRIKHGTHNNNSNKSTFIHTLIVARTIRGGDIADAMPCMICRLAIDNVGISNVIHT